MNSAPAYSPAPGYLLKLMSDGENPPVAMVAALFTTASSGVMPMAE